MRDYPTDYRLWALISGCLFSPLAAISLVVDGVGRIDEFVPHLFGLGIGCGLIGWLLHAAAVMCGVRMTGSADPGQAKDYDDNPPPASPAG